MAPDFSKSVVDNLAKRAAYKCSNPDCRVNTIGPNSNPEKATVIGEAAHIYGARIGAKRYLPIMTDVARAEITNSIWLCSNCHKHIDTDEQKYSSRILFIWREKHEEYIASIFGNNNDRIIHEEQIAFLKEFDTYPSIIKRIIIDRPNAWEYKLTAELMRYLNEPIFRKLNSLKSGLYLKRVENIDQEKVHSWIQHKLSELLRMAPTAVELLNVLTKSWGRLDEDGDVKEIHYVVKLIRDYLEHVVSFEEDIYFVEVPTEYEGLVSLLKNLIGSQVEKLSTIPSDLDEIAALSNEIITEDVPLPKVIKKEFIFELPQNWEKEFSRELNKINKSSSSGCMSTIIVLMISTILIFSI